MLVILRGMHTTLPDRNFGSSLAHLLIYFVLAAIAAGGAMFVFPKILMPSALGFSGNLASLFIGAMIVIIPTVLATLPAYLISGMSVRRVPLSREGSTMVFAALSWIGMVLFSAMFEMAGGGVMKTAAVFALIFTAIYYVLQVAFRKAKYVREAEHS